MKFTIDRAPLAKTLARMAAIVDRRSTIPILENALINAGPDGLSIAATDMDVELRETIPGAEIHTPGKTTAPAATLHDIARRLPDDRAVEFEIIESGDLAVRAGKSRFTVRTRPAVEFPVMSAGELPCQFAIPAADILKLLDRAAFAMSTEATRYYLNGIYLHAPDASQPILRAVATDGHRLARVDVPAPEGISDMPGIIIPRMTVAHIQKMLSAIADEVTLELSNQKIRITTESSTLTSRLVDGTFPAYDRVIPEGSNQILYALKDDLLSIVERVSVIDSDKTRTVKLSMSENGEDGLTVSAGGADKGTGVDEMDCKWSGPALDIGVNAKYLLENLKVLAGETVRMAIGDPSSPVVITDPEDTSSLYVLMPMRVYG